MNTKLWQPIQVGDIKLNHRLAMAPMTRSRSTAQGVPTDLNAEYYAQRASMALIISEGTQPSDDGQGYLFTPGIYTDEQVIGWRKVTDAVRSAGGQMFIQLMHVGRISHPANTPHGRQAVAPSAVKPNTKMVTPSGLQDIPEPCTLRADEIPAVIQEFRHAAAAARRAGAEGVEIHGLEPFWPAACSRLPASCIRPPVWFIIRTSHVFKRRFSQAESCSPSSGVGVY
jgi:N-ethylmaleimide reductase